MTCAPEICKREKICIDMFYCKLRLKIEHMKMFKDETLNFKRLYTMKSITFPRMEIEINNGAA